MHKILLAAAVGVGLLMLATAPAFARDLPAGGVTRQEVAAWLIGKGYPANIHNDSSGESIVSSTINTVNFDIYVYDCAADRCASIQYAAGWTPLAQGTPDRINEWNRDKRHVRAYLDKHNNVWGEYDIDVSPGGTWEQLDHTLTRFGDQIAVFKTFFGG